MNGRGDPLRRAAAALLDGLFPRHCAQCDLRTGRALDLCHECEQSLTLNSNACQTCALPSGAAGPCPACAGHAFSSIDRVRAPLVYDAELARLVARWKYRRELVLTPLLAALWLRHDPAPPAVDIVVPVPLHWRRLWGRGFNQAERLATALVRHHPGLSAQQLRPRLLRRHRSTDAQAQLGQRARAANLAGAFTHRERCDNLTVALVDDVCTTGATANAAARCLRAAGAARVELWCLARAPAPS